MLDGGVGEDVNDILGHLNNIKPLQGNTYIKYYQHNKCILILTTITIF